jgi:hypothetical protein
MSNPWNWSALGAFFLETTLPGTSILALDSVFTTCLSTGLGADVKVVDCPAADAIKATSAINASNNLGFLIIQKEFKG